MEIFSKLAMAFLEGIGDFRILNSWKFKLVSVKGGNPLIQFPIVKFFVTYEAYSSYVMYLKLAFLR